MGGQERRGNGSPDGRPLSGREGKVRPLVGSIDHVDLLNDLHGSVQNHYEVVESTHLCFGDAMGTQADRMHDAVAQLEDAGDPEHGLSLRLVAVGIEGWRERIPALVEDLCERREVEVVFRPPSSS